MKAAFRNLRTQQLERTLQPFYGLRQIPRPQKGWLRALREVTGITQEEIGKRLGTTRAHIGYLEQSEAEYRITLKNLRDAADAMDCQLVYALVPKKGTVSEFSEHRARAQARETVLAVEHTMALEDQAVGRVEDKIQEHTERLLKSR